MTRTFFIAVAVVFLIAFFAVFDSSLYALASAAAEGGEAKEVSLSPMEFLSNTAAWTLAIFLTVFAILYKFAFGPIAKALDEREQGILDKIASAQKQNDEAKSLLGQYQAKLDASKDEVRQIIESAKKDAQRQADDIVVKARDAAGLERDRAMKEIESATTSALQSIAERSATLATNLAGKMIRAEVKPEQHRNLIDAALNEFTRG
jgi:F-type H+-transporting ATPase subunit b